MLLTVRVLIGTSVVVIWSATAAHAKPIFKAPFPCGQTWTASTYSGHVPSINAIDFNRYPGQADLGQPAIASAPGTAFTSVSGSGALTVKVDHGGGWMSVYVHLSSFSVSNGSSVTTGQEVGKVGSSGADSPHLHYEQRLNNVGQPVELDGQRIPVGTTYTPSDPGITSTNCGGGGGGGGTTPTGNGGSRIVNPNSGRCVDANGASAANGTQIQLWDCNDGPAQQWVYADQALHIYGNYNKCLDADAGQIGANGTRLQVWDCNGGANQRFVAQSNGSLTSVASGRCLDATGAGTANGTPLQLWECNGGGAQSWVGIPTPNGGPPVLATASGRCLDVPGLGITPGLDVQLWDCNGSAAQQWASDGPRLRAYGDKCLDVDGGGTASGTAVQIWYCHDGPNQQWVWHSDGSITSVASGKCLDARGGATDNGTPLQLWECNSSSAQTFARPGSAAPPSGTPTTIKNLTPPHLTGKPRVRKLLVVTTGSWSVPGISIRYQWYRGRRPIVRANGPHYRLRPIDLGARLHVIVTATLNGVAVQSTSNESRRIRR